MPSERRDLMADLRESAGLPRTAEPVEPPFYRGEEYSSECDRLLSDDRVCDRAPAYEVWWTPVPAWDGVSEPVSAACAEHVVDVDRRQVARMHTHPEVTAARSQGASA